MTAFQPPAARRPTTHPASKSRGANIVTIASGKGGVGKTWLAITLAHAFARNGRHALLFDGDLGLANADIQLGLMPETDLGAVVAGKLRLDQAISAVDAGGFDIVAGKSGSGALATMHPERLATLRDDLIDVAANYEAVILDLGAGIDGAVRTLADNAGPKLVVTTAEPTALTDAYAFIKVVNSRQPGADLRVVVNMAANSKEGERTYNKLLKACQGFLRIRPPLAGIIRSDPNIPDAIRHQTPLLTRHPSTPAAADVEAMIGRLRILS